MLMVCFAEAVHCGRRIIGCVSSELPPGKVASHEESDQPESHAARVLK